MADIFDEDCVLGHVFLAVMGKLATLPELKFIDQDMGQLELEEGEMCPVKFPCALFDIIDIKYSDNSRKSQIAEAVLEVRIGLNAYSASTHYYQNDSHKKNALGYFNLEHHVNKALHGWSDDMWFNPLSRIGAKTERRKDNVRVRVLTYAFGFTDNTAMNVNTTTLPTAVDFNIVKKT